MSNIGRIANKGSGAYLNKKIYRQWHYANGQHNLVCADLGVSPDPDAPEPTAHEVVQELRDHLEWAHNRLDHLLTIFDERRMGFDDFSGPNETMQAVRDELPKIREKYKFKKAWPNGRFKPVKQKRG